MVTEHRGGYWPFSADITPALRSGEYEPLAAGPDVLGCRRTQDGKSVLALVNRGDEPADCFGVTVPPHGWVLQ